MAEKPEDAGNVPEFEKIIRNNKKSILDSVPPKYNISDFKEAHGNNSRNLQTKPLWLSNKNIYFRFIRFLVFIMINFFSSSC